MLSQTYSSHGFVIDMQEASALFERVREADPREKAVVDAVGNLCRIPSNQLSIQDLTDVYASALSSGPDDAKVDDTTNSKARRKSKPRKGLNGEHSPRAG